MNILLVLYALFGDNLGLAVIAIAILARLVLLPSTKKQTLMTRKMADLKPRLEVLQKKYKNNQEQLAKEQMKLYKDVGYNPVGCLGSFLPQILILAAIIGVIRAITDQDFEGVYPVVYDFVFGDGPAHLNTNFLVWNLSDTYTAIAKDSGYLSLQAMPYLILGLAVGVVQFVSTKFMQYMQGMSTPSTGKDEAMSQQEMQAQISKSMTTIFPLMTVFFTLSAPAVLGIYWFAQSLMMIVQYFLIDKDRSVEVFNKTFKRKNSPGKVTKTENPQKEDKVSDVKVVDAVKIESDKNKKTKDKTQKKKKKKRKNKGK
jgi:YidC/Oxa1 family membrane protein insertase